MLRNLEAGIDCGECDHCIVVKTREACEELVEELEWRDGDPVCPECGALLTFEDYLDE